MVVVCSKCNVEIKNQKTVDFSMRRFGSTVCWECQKGAKSQDSISPDQQEFRNKLSDVQIQMLHKDTIRMLSAGEIFPWGQDFDKAYSECFKVILVSFRKALKSFIGKDLDEVDGDVRSGE